MKKIRILAIIGMLWSLALGVFVIVITLIEREGWLDLIPAFAILGFHFFVFWRLFHLRRWAGIAGTAVVAWSGLAAFSMVPLALAMLAGAVYFGAIVRKAWPELIGGA